MKFANVKELQKDASGIISLVEKSYSFFMI